MSNENQNPVQAGAKPREQLRLPQGSYIQAMQWMDFLGYEQYCWWLKLHTHVNRKPDRMCENHIPYTLESLYKDYFKVSKATFYRKIKVLWEVGLIDFREYEKSERKSQKPKNIIVYEYPFNDARYEYLPLEKRRDWDRDYKSESVKAGKKGAEIQKQAKKEEEKHGLNSETVEKSVDNPVDNSPVSNVDTVDKYGLNSETVDGLNSETVTVSNLRPNHYSNKLLINTNNPNHNTNNLFLSQTEKDLIQKQLKKFNFTAGERETVIELINYRQIPISKKNIIEQAKYMLNRPDIRNRPLYFVNGLEMNISREYDTAEPEPEQPTNDHLPFYNWLEEEE
jgi:hypothetical protein